MTLATCAEPAVGGDRVLRSDDLGLYFFPRRTRVTVKTRCQREGLR